MEPTNLDLASIHPRNGAKFSPNLHLFLSTHRNRGIGMYGRAYRDKDGVLWIGYLDDDYLIGARLMQVLCNGSKTQTFAFTNLGPLIEVEGFWEQYQAHGRCAIDPNHEMYFVGDDTRWTGDANHRACLWCGKASQKREHWVEEVRRERWVLVSPTEVQTPSAISSDGKDRCATPS